MQLIQEHWPSPYTLPVSGHLVLKNAQGQETAAAASLPLLSWLFGSLPNCRFRLLLHRH